MKEKYIGDSTYVKDSIMSFAALVGIPKSVSIPYLTKKGGNIIEKILPEAGKSFAKKIPYVNYITAIKQAFDAVEKDEEREANMKEMNASGDLINKLMVAGDFDLDVCYSEDENGMSNTYFEGKFTQARVDGVNELLFSFDGSTPITVEDVIQSPSYVEATIDIHIDKILSDEKLLNEFTKKSDIVFEANKGTEEKKTQIKDYMNDWIYSYNKNEWDLDIVKDDMNEG